MLHKALKININRKLVTDKCFPIQWPREWILEAEDDSTCGPPRTLYFFKKHSYSVNIGEQKMDINIEKTNYKVKCQYIAINDIASLIIMPKESIEMIDVLEENQKIANKIYGIVIYEWLGEKDIYSLPLKSLYEIFSWLYGSIYEVLTEKIDYCDIDFDDLPNEMINEIKKAVLKGEYSYAMKDVLQNYGYDILRELGLLSKDDRSSNYEKDINLLDFYKNNQDFANRINKMIDEHLENTWLSMMNDSDFRHDVLVEFYRNLKTNKSSNEKICDIIFHSEIMRLLFKDNKVFTISAHVGNVNIEFSLLITLKNKKNLINWSFSSFGEIIDYPLVYLFTLEYGISDKDTEWIFKYHDKVCKKIYGRIKSYKVEYKFGSIYMKDIIVDYAAPRDNLIYVEAKLLCSIKLNKWNKYLWLRNDRVILGHLIGLYKIAKTILEIHRSINEKPILACSFSTYIEYFDPYAYMYG